MYSLLVFDREFRPHWRNYVFQCLSATLAIFVVMLFLSLQNAVIIGSLGATTFIVFALPKSTAANTRNIIGGYAGGLFWGLVVSAIPHTIMLVSLAAYSVAVGLSMFTMVVTNTDHPPASGAALGIAVSGMSANVLFVVFLSVVLLCVIHRVFKPYMRELR